MSVVAVVSVSQHGATIGFQIQHKFSRSKPMLRQGCSGIRCCNKELGKRANTVGKTYYELLGVAVDSNPQIIKQAYRNLQKKYHPDIAGQEGVQISFKGHEYTLKLNEAYKVLIKENLRKEYDSSIGQRRVSVKGNSSTFDGSSWNGVLRPQALFVDENACIGCRQCVHQASATYMFDEALGCARVKLQYGDDDQQIEVSIDSCPVNCIHWVEREDLAVLEFLIQPQRKEGHGIFGGGWERPANVFAAAKSFNKQLKEEADNEIHQRNPSENVEEETPAQAEARAEASMKIKMEAFSKFWHWQK